MPRESRTVSLSTKRKKMAEWGNTGTGYSIVCAPGEKTDAAAGEHSGPIQDMLVREALSCPHDVRHPQKF